MGAFRRMLGLSESKTETLTRELAVTRENTALAIESGMANLELALDDRGWDSLTRSAAVEFSREGLGRAAEICRVMAVGNPLIKRGLGVRQAYVWGQGIQIQARSNGEDGTQDVGSVIRAFLDEPGNRAAFTGDQAHEENERALGTDGNVFIACFTNPRTGFVQTRTIPFVEITDILANPEDADEPRYYRRQWNQTTIADGRTNTSQRVTYYPALDYEPTGRDRLMFINGAPVQWDTPVYHVSVNRLDGWQFGIADAFAAIQWARAHRDFLSDWATIAKALSQFAFRLSTDKTSKAQQMRQRIARTAAGSPGNDNSVGSTVVTDAATNIEAIPKTGAVIDSESGRPLAAMVGAALDIPVTTLLADPGQTGARAVAETLETPTRLAMEQRRGVWTEAYRAILGHVIRHAATSGSGPLTGNETTDSYTGQRILTLDQDTDATVVIDWPSLEEVDTARVVEAIVKADSTGKLPPLEVARLLLLALGVENVEDVLDGLTDADGQWVDPMASAAAALGQAAIDAYRRGEDPSAAVR